MVDIRTHFLKQSLTMDCEACTSWQQQLLEDGDGSQIICTHLEDKEKETKSNEIGKKRKQFISTEHFNKELAKIKPKEIESWGKLPIGVIYEICAIKERLVNVDGKKKRVARYAELKDVGGNLKHAWLTTIIDEEIKNYDIEKDNIFIRPLGKKASKVGGREYHDFDMIKQ